MISSIHWAEALLKLAERGQEPDRVSNLLLSLGLLTNALQIYPVDEVFARAIAKLRLPTQPWGLSLGDWACLALALQLPLLALTSDQVCSNLDVGVVVALIR